MGGGEPRELTVEKTSLSETNKSKRKKPPLMSRLRGSERDLPRLRPRIASYFARPITVCPLNGVISSRVILKKYGFFIVLQPLGKKKIFSN